MLYPPHFLSSTGNSRPTNRDEKGKHSWDYKNSR